MTDGDFVSKVSQGAFLDELHHLLWIDAFKKGNLTDLGWNCRDHALLLASVAMHFGFDVYAVTGKVAIIQGPGLTEDSKPVVLEQLFHTWINVRDVGTFDVSPNLSGIRQFAHGYSGFGGVLGSKVAPHGLASYFLTQHEAKYNTVFDSATNAAGQLSLVYLAKDIEPLAVGHLTSAFRWCNSPLTVRLKNLKIPTTAYQKAATHLVLVIEGRSESIRNLPQMEAWKKLASARDSDS